ncbi:hypothetical protein AB205_0120830 [Aquarana catesbeiana]|uniref:Uncharacterized protein n=1 Tax=Aquarana catesbeiana TaxID=8400 RepID=A0A2G9RWX8_AQUCT|nr:hypothetical protein AB205_0120830 [Aquarana catesbeiana]
MPKQKKNIYISLPKKKNINTFKQNAPFNVHTVKCFYYYNVVAYYLSITVCFFFYVVIVTKGLIN